MDGPEGPEQDIGHRAGAPIDPEQAVQCGAFSPLAARCHRRQHGSGFLDLLRDVQLVDDGLGIVGPLACLQHRFHIFEFLVNDKLQQLGSKISGNLMSKLES